MTDGRADGIADVLTGEAAPQPHPGPAASAWEDPPRRPPETTSPVLAVDGFAGPLDWLLEMARAKKIDLARLSILALVEAFAAAMDAALARRPGTAVPPDAAAPPGAPAPAGVPAPDLARWAAWTVMAAQLTELRSRLLLPADAPEARTAQAEAEALRQQWVLRAAMAAAADWLERRPQLGFDVFARGRPEAGGAAPGAGFLGSPAKDAAGDGLSEGTDTAAGRAGDPAPAGGGDITDLLRACLAALRLPPHAESYQPRVLPFWGISAAAARITRLLAGLPAAGADLGSFLPKIADAGSGRALHCRAAVAATFVAGLELTRGGALTLHQDTSWQSIQLRRRDDTSPDSAAESTTGEREPSLA